MGMSKKNKSRLVHVSVRLTRNDLEELKNYQAWLSEATPWHPFAITPSAALRSVIAHGLNQSARDAKRNSWLNIHNP